MHSVALSADEMRVDAELLAALEPEGGDAAEHFSLVVDGSGDDLVEDGDVVGEHEFEGVVVPVVGLFDFSLAHQGLCVVHDGVCCHPTIIFRRSTLAVRFFLW